MRRTILSLAGAGLVGVLMAGDASACHKTKVAACAPAPVAVCEAPAKKKCFKMPRIKMPKLGCHKKAACAPAPVAVCEAAPVYVHTVAETYSAPQSYAAPQTAATSQTPPVPGK